jgi:flagellar biosynthesis component FlhA
MTLSPQLESTLRASLGATDSGVGFQIDASLAQMLLRRTGEKMEAMAGAGHIPILLTPRELRLAFKRLVEQSLSNLIVLAYSEISTGTKVKAHGMVEMS